MTMYIGLDVHSKQTTFVAMDDQGEVQGQGVIGTTPEDFQSMLDQLRASDGTEIGLETGMQSMWVARVLSTMGMKPVVIDAFEVRTKARRRNQKSDLRDAFEICDGVRRGMYDRIVFVPSIEILRLRQVISRRRHFVRMSTSQINATKYLLRSIGLQKEIRHLKNWVGWEALLRRPSVAPVADHIELHATSWMVARDNVDALERELKERLEPFADIADLLQTVPGVGQLTAATYIAVIATPERFPTSAHAASYVGLVPSSYDSGDTVRRGHITKRGSPELRMILCEAAHHAARSKHPLNPYFARVCATQGYKRAVVAVAHRFCRILFQMWRKREPFKIERLNIVPETSVRKKTYHYRFRKPEEARSRA